MSFLEDIRKQPQHHREIMFGLCVVTTISLIAMVWYNSFEKNLYVLLNPGENADQRYLANENGEDLKADNATSLLGDIGKSGRDLKAAFYSIFNLTNDDKKENVESDKTADPGRAYKLPLSGKK